MTRRLFRQRNTAQEDRLTVEQYSSATGFDGAEADRIEYFVRAARHHDIVKLGVLGRPQFKLGREVKPHLAEAIRGKNFPDSSFRNFNRDLPPRDKVTQLHPA